VKKVMIGLALLALFGLAVSAYSKTSRHPKSTRTAAAVESGDADTRLCRDASRTLVAGFGRDLKAELIAAMKKGKLVAAVPVCGTRAGEIAAAHSGGGWTIKRINSRSTDTSSFADSLQKAAIAEFSAGRKTRPTYKEVWTTKDSVKTYHFYEPIIAQDFCLRCHGAKESLDPAVLDTIAAKYSVDRTTGFSTGDILGMFVLESKWPDGKEQAKLLTAGR
jgi:hypothetical protein